MSQPYDGDFYDLQRNRSGASARIVVPIVKEIVGPKSVLDIGCGIGAWSKVWIDSGVADLVGVDGDYVTKMALEIPQENFVSWDLTKPLDLERGFDLVQCLEVAEHLPERSADTLIETLTRHASVIFFSAAVPNQTGTHHVNEQWPSYWAEKFNRVGFDTFDPIRSRIWHLSDVRYWYRQNCLLFVKHGSPLAEQLTPPSGPIDIVHPALFENWATATAGFMKVRQAVAKTWVGEVVRRTRRR
jgi:SAM-dependent methyltransferase